jgi:hypothetical protein
MLLILRLLACDDIVAIHSRHAAKLKMLFIPVIKQKSPIAGSLPLITQ